MQARAHFRGLRVVRIHVVAHELRHVQNALRRQVVDRHHHRRLAVEPVAGRVVFRPAVRHVGDVRQAHHATVRKRPNHDVLERLGVVAAETATHDELLPVRLQASARRLDVRRANGGPDFGDGQIQFRQAVRAQRHFHFLPRKPAQLDLADAVQRPQVLFDASRFPLQGSQIIHARHRKRDRHPNRFLLEHNRRLHPHRERRDAVHRVFHVLKDVVRLVLVHHRHGDAPRVLAAHRLDLVEPGDALEVFLDFGHNAFLDLRRRRARKNHLNLDRLGFRDREKVALD